jgi:hypothetical protein
VNRCFEARSGAADAAAPSHVSPRFFARPGPRPVFPALRGLTVRKHPRERRVKSLERLSSHLFTRPERTRPVGRIRAVRLGRSPTAAAVRLGRGALSVEGRRFWRSGSWRCPSVREGRFRNCRCGVRHRLDSESGALEMITTATPSGYTCPPTARRASGAMIEAGRRRALGVA